MVRSRAYWPCSSATSHLVDLCSRCPSTVAITTPPDGRSEAGATWDGSTSARRRRTFHRAAALATTVTITFGSLLVSSGTASASDPNITFGADCTGWGPTCHSVFSRSYTKNVLAPAASGTATGLTAATVGLCTAVGGSPGGATCTAIFGTYAGASTAAINQAAAQNQCASYVTYFSDAFAVRKTDFGPDCH